MHTPAEQLMFCVGLLEIETSAFAEPHNTSIDAAVTAEIFMNIPHSRIRCLQHYNGPPLPSWPPVEAVIHPAHVGAPTSRLRSRTLARWPASVRPESRWRTDLFSPLIPDAFRAGGGMAPDTLTTRSLYQEGWRRDPVRACRASISAPPVCMANAMFTASSIGI
jgi:hypothetical protein